MKKQILTLALCICAFLTSTASHRSVSITQAGSLSRAINSSEVRGLDSLTVAGPMNLSDLRVAWDGAYYGSLKFLDISKASFEDNKIPDYAFFDADIQKGEHAFLDINEIVLPSNLEAIGAYSFRNTMVTKMKLPASLKTLGEGSFYTCNLAYENRGDSFSFPEGIEEIPDYCFYGAFSASELRLPSTIRRIGEAAFSGTFLKKVVFPPEMEAIADKAFFSTSLEEVEFTGNCQSLGEQIFNDSPMLKSISLPDNAATIPSYFLNGSAIRTLEIPEAVRVIKKYAFGLNGLLEDVVLHEGIEEIDDNAFYNSGKINMIILPSTLQRVGSHSFKTPDVYCSAVVPPACADNFNDKSFTLYVLPGLKSVYESAPGWSAADEIIEIAAEQFPVAGIKTIDAAADTEITVTSAEGGILVNSLKNGPVSFSVYSTDGTLIHKAAANPESEVRLPAGIYIVATADDAVKVAVR